MQLLSAQKHAHGYRFRVLLDTSKEADPAYVLQREWAKCPTKIENGIEVPDWPGGIVEYEAMIVREMQLLAAHELERLQPPIPATLSVEGSTFN